MSAWLVLFPVAEQNYEAEADDISVLLMAEAGFDPRVVPSVFERLNGLAGRESRANTFCADESFTELRSEAWNSKHPHRSPAIARITSKVWKSLYLTGKGPLHPDLSCGEIRDLEKSKQRWQNFLQQRPRPIS
ncbi:MAG: hypothetical protein LQ339_006407 [Xanthoria mediterranea]|nr:MAG: hypothetical protein LQ339_006407 [Xanthoria mediterranea]